MLKLSPLQFLNGLGLWYFWHDFQQYFSHIVGSQFYRWRKPAYPWKKHRPVESHWQVLSHINCIASPWAEFKLHFVKGLGLRLLMFNATFNILVTSILCRCYWENNSTFHRSLTNFIIQATIELTKLSYNRLDVNLCTTQ